MRYALGRWDEIAKRCGRRDILLFLDYDGTLAPISRVPGRAFMPEATRRTLVRLAGTPGIRTAIVSGRTLEDLKKMAGPGDIIYAANHGLDIEGPGIRYSYLPGVTYDRALKSILSELRGRLAGIPNIIVEDKGGTISLHYRKAARRHVPLIKDHFFKAVAPYLAQRAVSAAGGKQVWEIRPRGWNKGKATGWLAARFKKDMPVYIGDDVTDEDAFRALGARGITVRVGRSGSSAAAFYLDGTGDVRVFVERLIRLKTGG